MKPAYLINSAVAVMVLIFIGLAIFQGRPGSGEAGSSAPAKGDQPQDVFWKICDAAREGNVPAYLACFAGELQQQLARHADTLGRQQFADYLRRVEQPKKGITAHEVQQIDTGHMRMMAEYTYEGTKVEMQDFEFRKVDRQWRIVRMDTIRERKAAIPYGTPVVSGLAGENDQKGDDDQGDAKQQEP